MIRRRLWKSVFVWCAAAALIILGTRALMRRHHAAVLAQAQHAALSAPEAARDMPEAFRRVWTAPVTGFRAAGISPDANWIGIVADEGDPGVSKQTIMLWNWRARPDRPMWIRPDCNIGRIALAPNGEYVVTGSQMDPVNHALSVRNGIDGTRIVNQNLDGAIWDLQISADGAYASCVTGQRSAYVMNLSDRPRFHRWQLPGNANSVAISPNDAYLVAGTWDDSGVSCYTLTGALVWQYPGNPNQMRAIRDRLFQARMTPDGGYILGLSFSNVHHRDGEIYLWRADGDGTPLWTSSLGSDTVDPRVAGSIDGRFIAVSYVQNITRGAHSIPERLLVMLDQQNRHLWHWGGFLFSPTLIALSPDGQRVTVWDGRRTFYNLNRDGRITSSYAMPGKVTVQNVTVTPDGRSLLIYTSDGSLSLLQIGSW